MAKDDNVMEFEGSVVETLPNATFKVKLPNDMVILAHISGKMRLHYIKIIPGDKVLVEVKEIDDMGRVNLTRRGLIERWDSLAANPDFAEAVAVERAREARYSEFKDSDRRSEKQDRPKREHRNSEETPHRHTIRRFERKK